MSSILLEIGLEEVPARFMNACLNDLQSLILKNLTGNRLVSDKTTIQSYGTYRRFIIMVDHLLDKQADIDQQVDGPPVVIAKSESGGWLPPAIGFAKKMNASTDDLIEIENKKGQSILALNQFIVGESAIDLLPTIIEDAVYAMKLPIAMKWGNNIGPFIRPLKWICALLNDSVINVELFGIKSANITYGHRFLTNGNDSCTGKELEINSANDYVTALASNHVIIDAQKRQQIIVDQLLELNAFLNESEIDSGLLQEVCFLVENPTVLGVPFDESFLQLPKEVLVECLKKHQKAFLAPDNDHVKNTCYIVADSITNQNKSTVIDGNKRVMLARLNDVQFFWDEDLKHNGFGHWNEKLFNIVFQEGLGSIGDKVERVCHICHTIMDQLNTSKQTRDMVDRAAHRAKADLVSQMVGELPSLQGTMGGYYGLLFKEDPDVSIAIADHYKPRFDGDDMPSSIGGVIISIADRIDTMISCFENNAIPTGSRDPWGIRRSMIAIMRMIIEFDLPLNIELLLEDATITLDKKISESTSKCHDFFKKRVETVFLDHGITPELIQLLDHRLLKDPIGCFKNAQALIQLKVDDNTNYSLLIDTTTRVSKIIQNASISTPVQVNLFKEDIEITAHNEFQDIYHVQNEWLLQPESRQQVLQFCQRLSAYFESVLINSDDQDLARNRQAFMKDVNAYFNAVGDWLKLSKV